MMLLPLWPVLLFVVGWITVTHFSGVSLTSIFVNYSASKIVQLESYTSRYAGITPVLKILNWLPVEHRSARIIYELICWYNSCAQDIELASC